MTSFCPLPSSGDSVPPGHGKPPRTAPAEKGLITGCCPDPANAESTIKEQALFLLTPSILPPDELIIVLWGCM
jgi:hypothetical protein